MSSAVIKYPFFDGLKTAPPHSKEDVEHIKEWLSCMPHLPQLTDEHIHLFLHSNYSQLESTKKTIDNFFTMRTHAPELFAKLDPFLPNLQRNLNTVESSRTDGRTPEGYTVWFHRLFDTDPSKLDFMALVKMFFMSGDMLISEDGLSPGFVVVFDLKGVVLSHLATISLSAIKTSMNYIQEGSPVRMKNIYVINAVPFMDRLMALVKPFMKAELASLLHIHDSSDILADLFPAEAIPQDYGGKGKTMAQGHGDLRKLMETKYVPFFEHWPTLKVDESKRPGKAGSNKLFGAEGSFRTLSID